MNKHALSKYLFFFFFGIIVLFSLLRFWNLEADFPANITPCTVLYTDEGWYANNTLAVFLTGHWHVPHDINFAVNLPVLELVYVPFFAIAGPTMFSVRLTIALFFLLSLFLMFKILRFYVPVLPALLALVFATTNHFWFAYSRLGVGEIPLSTFILLSLWLLIKFYRGKKRRIVFLLLSSLTFSLAFFTKTNAFLFLPPLIIMIRIYSKNSREFFKHAGIFLGIWAGIVLIHFLFIARLYYEDYMNFHAMNIGMETHFSPDFLWRNFRRIFRRARYAERMLIPILFLSSLFFAIRDRKFRNNPLFIFCAASFLFHIAGLSFYEANRPRYYVPLFPVYAFTLSLLFSCFLYRYKKRWLLYLFSGVFLISSTVNISRTLKYLHHPRYSFQEMSHDIKNLIEEENDSAPAILGSMASNIALYTGVFPVNDWFETFHNGLYRPGYLVTLGPLWEEYILVLNEYADLKFVRTYSVYENYRNRNVWLYRLYYHDEKGQNF